MNNSIDELFEQTKKAEPDFDGGDFMSSLSNRIDGDKKLSDIQYYGFLFTALLLGMIVFSLGLNMDMQLARLLGLVTSLKIVLSPYTILVTSGVSILISTLLFYLFNEEKHLI